MRNHTIYIGGEQINIYFSCINPPDEAGKELSTIESEGIFANICVYLRILLNKIGKEMSTLKVFLL